MTDWQRAHRPRRRVGRGVEPHRVIGSTNDRAATLLAEPAGEGRAVVAEQQTDGRGRRGRSWLSPPGVNLMASVAIRPRLAAGDAWRVSAAAALATRRACAIAAPGVVLMLKWPNDVVARDGAKLAGLLIETTIDGAELTAAVIGIGINVNWPRAAMPPEIAAAATSLADQAGASIDRVELLGALLDALDDELVAVEAGVSPLSRYRAACATLGAEVEVETPDGRLSGRAVEIDDRGALVLEIAGGRVALSSGEIVRVRAVAPA